MQPLGQIGRSGQRAIVALLSVVVLASLVGAANAANDEPLTQEDLESIEFLRQTSKETEQLLQQAEAAFATLDWTRAEALFGKLPIASEETARYPLRRRCEALTELGRRGAALAACRKLMNLVIPN